MCTGLNAGICPVGWVGELVESSNGIPRAIMETQRHSLRVDYDC
jgi:hypothetical protein